MNASQILFIDIETVSAVPNYKLLSDRMRALWDKKARLIYHGHEEKDAATLYKEKAAIYAEFGKVVCISMGYIQQTDKSKYIRISSYSAKEEREILLSFADMLNQYSEKFPILCAHNGKEFDFAYLCRRMIVNGIALPPQLRLSGKKPWENPHLDTLEMWKFGDLKNFTSLDLLAAVLGIESPKSLMDGSMVGDYYYEKSALPEIVKYCEQDVQTLIKVFYKLNFPDEALPQMDKKE